MSMKDYDKIKVIGKGTFGRAILVKKKSTGEQMIIKHIAMGQLSIKEKKEAINEINVLRQLKHPHIIGYRKSFEEDGNLCIVMDYAQNGDLYQLIRSRKGKLFSEETIMKWFVQIASALEYTHSKHILHRDLKTQNIFLGKNNNVLVGDFGIARILQNTMECAHTLVGTPYYLSPELCREEPYNQKSDVWSLGCILYELATHRHAFEANSMKGLVGKILRGIYPAISSQYSQSLRNLVDICLQKEARKRPSVIEILQMDFVKKYSYKYSMDQNNIEEYVRVPTPPTKSPVKEVQPSSRSSSDKEQRVAPQHRSEFSKYHKEKASEIKKRIANKYKEEQQREAERALIEERKRRNKEFMEEKRKKMEAEREIARQRAALEMERLENEKIRMAEERRKQMRNRERDLLEAEAERRRIWEENRAAAIRNKQRLHEQVYGVSETSSQDEYSPAPTPQPLTAFPQTDDRKIPKSRPSTHGMSEEQLANFRKQQFWDDKMQAKRNRERIIAQMNGESISEPVEPAPPLRKVTPKVAWEKNDNVVNSRNLDYHSEHSSEVKRQYEKEREARDLYMKERALYLKEKELREQFEREKALLKEKELHERDLRERELREKELRDREARKSEQLEKQARQIETKKEQENIPTRNIEGLCFRIESLRLYLEKAIGLNAFVECYELLRHQEESDDDDLLNENLLRILGKERMGYISQIYQLIVCEDTFNESQQ